MNVHFPKDSAENKTIMTSLKLSNDRKFANKLQKIKNQDNLPKIQVGT